MANDVEIRIKADDDTKRGFTSAKSNAESLNDRLTKLTGRYNVLKSAAISLGPAMIPVLAVGTAAAVGMGAALTGAGSALGVFGAVTKSAFTEVKDASDKSADLRDKMRLLKQEAKIAPNTALHDKYMKQLAAATREYDARLAALPPTTRAVVRSYDNMTSSWQSFVDKNKPAVYGVMTKGFDTLGRHISDLQPLFDTGARFAGRWVNSISSWMDKGGLKDVVAFLNGQAGPALDRLTNIFTNLASAGGSLADAAVFSESGGLLGFLERGSAAIKNWGDGGGFKRLMDWLDQNGPHVGQVVEDVATAMKHIGDAVFPLAPLSLALADGLAKIVSNAPPGVIQALAGAYVALSIGVRAVASAQFLANIAFSASPIGRVIALITALIAVFLLVKAHAVPIANAFLRAWNVIRDGAINMVIRVLASLDRFLGGLQAVVGFMARLPGPMGAPFRAMQGPIQAARDKIQNLQRSMSNLKSRNVSVNVSSNGVRITAQVRASMNAVRSRSVVISVASRGVEAVRREINSITGHAVAIQVGLVGRGPRAEAHGGVLGAAGGGPRSRLTMVGEHGRELVDLPPGSRVRSNPDTERMLAGGGGAGTVINLVVNAPVGSNPRDIGRELYGFLDLYFKGSGQKLVRA